jgi:hypothetical protein
MSRTLSCLCLMGFLLASGCGSRSRLHHRTDIRVFGSVSSRAVEEAVAEAARDAGFDSDSVVEWTSVSTDEVRVFEKAPGSPAGGYQGLKGETRGLVVEYYRSLRRVKIKSHPGSRWDFPRAVILDIYDRLSDLEGAQVYCQAYLESPE